MKGTVPPCQIFRGAFIFTETTRELEAFLLLLLLGRVAPFLFCGG